MSAPYLIGENNAAAGATTLVVTVATATSKNDVLFVAVNSAGAAATGVSDSQGNTYELINSDITEVDTYQFQSVGDTKALSATGTPDTITVTYAATGGAKAAIAIGMTGVQPRFDNLALPATVNGPATSTSASITSGNLTEAKEVVLTVLSTDSTASGPTWGTGWTQISSTRQAASPWLSVAYKIPNGNGPQTATATFTAARFCALMSSFIQPRASFPYLLAEGEAASGGATSLTMPVRSQSGAGDTIVVGAACTSGSVTGVTDSAGNTYAQVPGSPVGAAGSQLYTFAAYDTDSIQAGTHANAGRVGVTNDYRNYTFTYTATNGGGTSPCVFTNTGTGCEVPVPNGTQVQLNGGTPPGGFTNGTTYYVVGTLGVTFSLAATPGGTPINSTSSGSGAQTFFLVGTNTQYSGYQAFDNNVGFGAGLGTTASQKWFNAASVYPSTFTLQNGQDATSIVATGAQIYLCLNPANDGSDLSAMQTCLEWWVTNAVNVYGTSLVVVLHNEPQNAAAGLTASAFIAMFQAYAPMVHSLGLKTAYIASGHASSEWQSWYPGNTYCDIIGVDYYGTTWARDTGHGTRNLDPLAAIHQLADANGKPFGIQEIGQATYNAGGTCSDADFVTYIQYITNLMSGRLRQGLANSDVMWFNSAGAGSGNAIMPGDWRVPYLDALNQQLTSQAASITVNYSSNASVQAAIAVGDNNVTTAGSDITVGASGTGTAPSVATGTLAQAEEHIIAFVADASPGGIPVLGDGLCDLGMDALAGGTIGLKAGFKTVSTTASDTPSATIASAAWSISVVTNKVLVPVIQAPPTEGYVSETYSFTFTAAGGIGTLTWAETGTLPPGLTLSSAGVLSGTPTTQGAYPVTITATDSLGLQGTLATTISILGTGGPGGAPAVHFPANILSDADCDSETSTGYTWASYLNANAPARSSFVSICGSDCTSWTVPASGMTQIATGNYPVLGGLPYICSAFLLAGNNNTCNIGIAWYDSTNTLIDVVDQSTSYGAIPGGWTPLSFATVSPANAVTAKLVATVDSASAGDVYNLELAFLAQAVAQILVDWNNPAFNGSSAAGLTFMDVTPWVRFDQNVSYMRGRQAALTEIQAASGQFVLQNDHGEFSRFSSQAIPAIIGGAVSLQRRCQLNVADQNSQWWTRLDGPISEIDYAFDNTGNTSTATVMLTDVLADLSRQDPMFCWTKEQVFANGPVYHWTLDDPGNTGGTGPAGAGPFGTAAETSGNNGPPMRLVNSDSSKTATIQWQDTTGGVETLADAVAANKPDGSEYWTPGSNQPTNLIRGLDAQTVGPYTTPLGSVYFTPALTAQSAQNTFVGNRGYMLQAELQTPVAPTAVGSDYTVECWFTMDPAVGQNLSALYGPYIPIALGTSRTYTNLLAGLFLNSGAMKFETANYSQPPAFLGLNWPGSAAPTALASTSVAMTADTVQIPHHLVLVITGDPATPTVTTWLDGTNIGSFNLPKGQTYDTICVGGAYGGCGTHHGNVSCVSIYGYAMSAQQIMADCQLGQYGLWETPSDDTMTQLAQFAAVPPFWNNVQAQHAGLTMMEYIDITGSNALASMQLIEQAEQGLLFVNSQGQLTFHTRAWRMGYGPPDLLLPPDTYSASLGYQVIDQFMCNEMGVSGPSTTGATAPQGTTQGATTPQQQPNSTASALLTAGYINTAAQQQYGVYSSNPVSSPIALPLITWSRAYAQLGIPSLSYWPDPSLIDVAAWNANSRSDPWLLPSTLTIDLLTLDPADGLGISDFYGLDIDNMIAPTGTLPASLPNQTAPLEWFIEGISETIGQSTRTLQIYTSPVMNQRAWIPGDPVYGVLGSTTRVGISQSDLSTPQADGKDVSHDAGGPYWPPAFSNSLNNPGASSNPFVGATDLRGLTENLKLLLEPPMCIVSALSQTQNFNNGSLANPVLNWDTLHVDTAGGMGLYPGYPQWYVVTVPGWYEIDVSVPWSLTGAGLSAYTGQAWIVVAMQAAQGLGAGLSTPLTVNQYVCPVGEAVCFNSASMNPICAGTTRMYLGLGDMVAVACEQNYTASRGTSTGPNGAHMSIRCTGIGTVDDRTELNSSIASGGTVTLSPHGLTGQKVYQNTHTYSYQGSKGFSPNARRNTDLDTYQGTKGNNLDSEGSQVSQVAWNTAQMISDLTGHTITSVTLTCKNDISWYNSGTKLMLGYTTVAPGGTTFKISSSSTTVNVVTQFFKQNQTLTFTIPTTLFEEFLTGGATAFVLGDDKTTNLDYYGAWVGGPANWTLTVNYK